MNGQLIAAILTALIVSLISPLALAYVQGRQRRADKLEDWARQDAVAMKLEEATKAVGRANDQVVATAKMTTEKLDTIHTLVNSSMTAALQAELDATSRELAMMYEVMALNKKAGRRPSVETTNAIQKTKGRISELAATLSSRMKTQQEQAALHVESLEKRVTSKPELVKTRKSPAKVKKR